MGTRAEEAQPRSRVTAVTEGVTAAPSTPLSARSDPWQGAGGAFPRPFPSPPPGTPHLESHPIPGCGCSAGGTRLRGFCSVTKLCLGSRRKEGDVTWKGGTGKKKKGCCCSLEKLSLPLLVSGSLRGIIQMRAGSCSQEGGARNRFLFFFLLLEMMKKFGSP